MRTCLAFALVSALAACGGGSNPGGGDDEPPLPDGGGSGSDGSQTGRTPTFTVESPPVTIMPGQEITYCYYFKMPTSANVAIDRWESSMTPGSHHMIVYTSQDELRPEGTIDDASCGMGASFPFPSWLYSAQTSEAAIQLPGDDGAGKPLGMEVLANQPAFVQMHYLNATDAPIDAHVTLRAYALDAGREFTKTAAYVTYYGNIDIPAQAVNHVEPANLRDTTCSVPAGSKFWLMSTHAHKQAVKTRVLDGTTSVFESTDWEHPEPALWTGTAESPFYSFASGKLSYECTYTNPTNRAISTGDSAATDEMCMASGYYFPATSPKFCYNNQAL